MSLDQLIFFAEEFSSANKSENTNEPREATQADIDAFLA
jgi:hypothetical protein